MADVRRFKPKEASEPNRAEDFAPGSHLAFLDEDINQWRVAELISWQTPPKDMDGNFRARVRDFSAGRARDISFSLPPKQVDLPDLTADHNISGQNYRVQLNSIRILDDDSVEFTLVNTARRTETITGVSSEMLKNLDAVNSLQTESTARINALKTEVMAKADARGQEIFKGLSDLEQKLETASSKLASLEEWQEMDAEEALEIGKQIKKLQEELEAGLKDFKTKVDAIKPITPSELMSAEAKGWSARLTADREDRLETAKETKETEKNTATDTYKKWERDFKKWEGDHKKWVDAGAKHDDWDIKHAAWQTKKNEWDAMTDAERADKANKDKKPASEPPEPPRQGVEPVEPVEPPKPERIKDVKDDEVNARAAYDLYITLTGTEYAGLSAKHKTLIDKITAEINKKVAEAYTGALSTVPEKIRVKLVAEIFDRILTEEGGKVEAEGYKFDLKKEKTELKNKWTALGERAIKSGSDRAAVEARLTARIAQIDAIVDTDVDKETKILQLWRDFADAEVDIFKTEQSKIVPEKKEIKQGDIDIPDVVLRDLIGDRQPEVRATMEAILRNQLRFSDEGKTNLTEDPAVVGALKELMKRRPSDAMLTELRRHGIKNWESFQKLWEGGMAIKAAKVIHEWGQADLKNEIVRQTGALDTMGALKWQLGARIVTNVALVGGGAFLATSMLATGGLTGVALAAAGGAAGGGIRAGLQKLLFGSKFLEDRKKAKLDELAESKRTQIIENVLSTRFPNNLRSNVPGLRNRGDIELSSILAEAIRAASAEANLVQGEADDFVSAPARALQGDPKRLYIKALKNARESGLNPAEEQKMSLAIALESLISKNDSIDAVKSADPVVIRMLDGVMSGYSGASASKENYGAAGAAGTVALGATVGAAFYSNSMVARGVLGGLGGAVAGYKVGESWRKNREFTQAEAAFNPVFLRASAMWDRFYRDPSSLTSAELRTFGEQIQTFNRYLTGEADTLEGQKIAELIQSRPQLKQQVENLVYQAYRRGVFARLTLDRLQEHTNEAVRDSNVPLANKDRAAWEKAGLRALYTTGGAVAGAALAVGAGWAINELKANYYTVPDRISTAGADAKLAAVAATHDMDGITNRNMPISHVDDLRHAAVAHHDSIPTHETVPHFEKPTSVATETVSQGGSPWRSMDHFHSAHKADLFKGWSQAKFNEWRNGELENMGFKRLPNGDILHPYDVKPGAQFELFKDADGSVHMRPAEGSMDKFPEFHDKAGNRIYMVEHHGGGKTPVIPEDNFKKAKIIDGKMLDASGRAQSLRNAAVQSPDEKQLFHLQDTVKVKGYNVTGITNGADGNNYAVLLPEVNVHKIPTEPINLKYFDPDSFASKTPNASKLHFLYPDARLMDVKTGNIFDGQEHKFLGNIHETSVAKSGLPASLGERNISGGGTSWRQGDLIKPEDVQKMNTLAHGKLVEGTVVTKPGVAVAESAAPKVVPEAAPVKGVEAIVSMDHSSEKVVIPEEFAGHEVQYVELRTIRSGLMESLAKDSHLKLVDKIGLVPKLMDKVQLALSQNPDMLKNPDVVRALDVSQHLSNADRYNIILGTLADKHAINLSLSERMLLGGNHVMGDDFEHVKVKIDGVDSDITVAKGDGTSAYRMRNLEDNSVTIITDPEIKYNKGDIALLFQ